MSLLAVPHAAADPTTSARPGDHFPGFTRLQGDQEPAVAGAGEITAVGVQSTGRIVIAQHSTAGTTLRRLGPDGTPDPTWGTDGKISLGPQWIEHIIVTPDDKVIIADSDVRQFTVNGHLDLSFSGDGVAPIVVESHYQGPHAKAVTREPDGDLLVVGEAYYTAAGDWDVFATRFHADGAPDTGFRQDRKVYSSTDVAADNTTVGALPGSGDSYYLVGKSGEWLEDAPPRIWRLASNANWDSAPVILPLPAGRGVWSWIPGKDAAEGYLSVADNEGGYLAKLMVTSDGLRVDRTWGATGVVRDPSTAYAHAGAVQADGWIVLATASGLVRRHPDGTLDTTFDSAPSRGAGGEFLPYDVALTREGGILSVGRETRGGGVITPFVDKFIGALAHTSTGMTHGPTPGLTQQAVITYQNVVGRVPDAGQAAEDPRAGRGRSQAQGHHRGLEPDPDRLHLPLAAQREGDQEGDCTDLPGAAGGRREEARRARDGDEGGLRRSRRTVAHGPDHERCAMSSAPRPDGDRFVTASGKSRGMKTSLLAAATTILVSALLVPSAGTPATGEPPGRVGEAPTARVATPRVADPEVTGQLIASPPTVGSGRAILITGQIGGDLPRRVALQVRNAQGWTRGEWKTTRREGLFQFTYRAPHDADTLWFRVRMARSRHLGLPAAVTPTRRVRVTE